MLKGVHHYVKLEEKIEKVTFYMLQNVFAKFVDGEIQRMVLENVTLTGNSTTNQLIHE